MRLSLDGAERRWGAPYLAMHRADLQQALARIAARRHTIRLARHRPSTAGATDGGAVAIERTRGRRPSQDTADLLVGARRPSIAGPRKVRGRPRRRPRFSGRVAFRATIPATSSTPAGGGARRAAARAQSASGPLPAAQCVDRQCRRCDRSSWRGGEDRASMGRRRRPAGARSRVRRLVRIDAQVASRRRPTGAPGRSTSVRRSARSRLAASRSSATPPIRWSRSWRRARRRRSRTRGRSGGLAQTDDIPQALAGLFSRPRGPGDARPGRGGAAGPDLSPERSDGGGARRDHAPRRSQRLGARYDWLYGA